MSDADCYEIFTSIDRNATLWRLHVTRDEQYTLPGFKYRSVTFTHLGYDNREWLARVSFLIPCAILLAISCTCVLRYRVVG